MIQKLIDESPPPERIQVMRAKAQILLLATATLLVTHLVRAQSSTESYGVNDGPFSQCFEDFEDQECQAHGQYIICEVDFATTNPSFPHVAGLSPYSIASTPTVMTK